MLRRVFIMPAWRVCVVSVVCQCGGSQSDKGVVAWFEFGSVACCGAMWRLTV